MNLRPLAILLLAASPALAITSGKQGAREFYNEGVGKLGKGELRDAEMALRKAAGSEVESVQPLALYNLGHVRFRQGEETLKGEGNRQHLLDSSVAAVNIAEEAIRNGGRALESDELKAIIAAYMDARAAQKDLRISRDETSRTLGLIGSALERWRRSVGDFHSALELDASNADANANAAAVERKIEELLKFKKQIEQQSEQVSEKRDDVKAIKKKLRGKIPKDMQRESDDEEDDDDDKDKDEKGDPKIGEKQQQRLGSDREVSPDMARWLKETMKRRTMSLGTQQEGDHLGHLGGLAQALHRGAAEDAQPGVLAREHGRSRQFGGDGARPHRVDADVTVGQRQRHGARELVDAALAGVVEAIKSAAQTGDCKCSSAWRRSRSCHP
jgi:hypothetical protein